MIKATLAIAIIIVSLGAAPAGAADVTAPVAPPVAAVGNGDGARP